MSTPVTVRADQVAFDDFGLDGWHRTLADLACIDLELLGTWVAMVEIKNIIWVGHPTIETWLHILQPDQEFPTLPI